jgi:hypothetical protein
MRCQAQFRNNPVLVFDASEDITPDQIRRNLAVFRDRLGQTSETLNLVPSQYHLLAITVWIIPDSRRCPRNAVSDPVAAGIPFISSLAIFQLQPLPLNPEVPLDEHNLFWQASLIANKFQATADHPAVDFPKKMVLSVAPIVKGFSPFSSFKAAFADIVWPPNAVFLECGAVGRPVSARSLLPVVVAPPAPRGHAPAPAPGPLVIAIHADEERIARESKIKQSTRDHEATARFRGLFAPATFTALFGDDTYPTLTGAKESVCEIISRTVTDFGVTEAQASSS